MSIKFFYQSAFFRSLAEGLISPFMPVFALSLGATKTLIGLLSTLPSLTSLFSQLFWSVISETVKKKKWLVIFGGIAWAIFWIPVAHVSDPIHLVILTTLQALFSSVAIPAWTALFIHATPSYKRGRITGILNISSAIGSFLGTIAAGIILKLFGFIPFLFFLVCLLGLISRLVFLPFSEPKMPVYTLKRGEILGRFFWFDLRKEKKLWNLIKAMIFFNFSVSIASPFFSVYIIQSLGGSTLDIAAITVIGIITSIISYRAWGKLIDYIGKKAIMISCLVLISFVPFVYAISPNVYWLYLFTVVSHMSWAGFELAAFTYFSDIVPKERTSSYVGFYNLLTGLSSSFAPFVGGIIADFSSIWLVFIISTLLRILSIYFFDRLEERVRFKPKGIFKFEFEPFGISYKIETFISTYSLAIEEIRKEMKIIDFKRYVKLKK